MRAAPTLGCRPGIRRPWVACSKAYASAISRGSLHLGPHCTLWLDKSVPDRELLGARFGKQVHYL